MWCSRSRGGLTNWENIVCACLRCNVRKGAAALRTRRKCGLIRRPVKPKRSPMLAHQLTSIKYEFVK